MEFGSVPRDQYPLIFAWNVFKTVYIELSLDNVVFMGKRELNDAISNEINCSTVTLCSITLFNEESYLWIMPGIMILSYLPFITSIDKTFVWIICLYLIWHVTLLMYPPKIIASETQLLFRISTAEEFSRNLIIWFH